MRRISDRRRPRRSLITGSARTAPAPSPAPLWRRPAVPIGGGGLGAKGELWGAPPHLDQRFISNGVGDLAKIGNQPAGASNIAIELIREH